LILKKSLSAHSASLMTPSTTRFCIGAEPLVLGTCAVRPIEKMLMHVRNVKKNSNTLVLNFVLL